MVVLIGGVQWVAAAAADVVVLVAIVVTAIEDRQSN